MHKSNLLCRFSNVLKGTKPSQPWFCNPQVVHGGRKFIAVKSSLAHLLVSLGEEMQSIRTSD